MPARKFTTPTIGKLLQRARKDQGLAKTEAARKVGVARQTYYHWEDDYSVPGLDRVAQIAEFTGTDQQTIINDILRRSGFPNLEVARASKRASRSTTLQRKSSGSLPSGEDEATSSIPGYVRSHGLTPTIQRGAWSRVKVQPGVCYTPTIPHQAMSNV